MITNLVGDELEEVALIKLWEGDVAGFNGSIYGIPACAHRVVKSNLFGKSIAYIEPDFGRGYKWCKGAITDSGVIYKYCVPNTGRGILKIDTNTDTVTELDANLLPERDNNKWLSCAAAPDGCVYCMPATASHILKVDPNNEDAMSSVGDISLGGDGFQKKYIGTVVGIDGCIYGMPSYYNRNLKYDPNNAIISFVGEEINRFRFYLRRKWCFGKRRMYLCILSI